MKFTFAVYLLAPFFSGCILFHRFSKACRPWALYLWYLRIKWLRACKTLARDPVQWSINPQG